MKSSIRKIIEGWKEPTWKSTTRSEEIFIVIDGYAWGKDLTQPNEYLYINNREESKMCKHEKWLYVPPRIGIGDGNLISFGSRQVTGFTNILDDDTFLCADCGEWIGIDSLSIEKIVNVKHLPREECSHDIRFYTILSKYLCLRCGFEWYPERPKLDIKPDNFDYKQLDIERRKKILDDYKQGAVY